MRQLINWLHFKANPRKTLNFQNESKHFEGSAGFKGRQEHAGSLDVVSRVAIEIVKDPDVKVSVFC